MLKEILTGKQCEECKGCCRFDKSDIWIYPKVTEEESKRIFEKYGVKMQKLGENIYGFESRFDENGIVTCPALGEQGCILGDNKPVSCKYYPVVLVKKDGKVVIALDSFCREFKGKEELIKEYTEKHLAKILFEHAKTFPGDVFDFTDGMTVLKEEQ